MDVTTRSNFRSSFSARDTVPLLALGVLVLIVIANWARPKTGQTFDGLLVVNLPLYEFYPNVKDCPARGTPYWFVPDENLNGRLTFSLDDLTHGVWRVKFRGDLSHVGRYGYFGRYWREVRVEDVYELSKPNCAGFR